MFTEYQEIKLLLESLSNKRARVVIEHILANGFVTTEQLATENQFPIPEYIKQVMVKYLDRTKDD